MAAYSSNGQMERSELWGKFATCDFQYSSSYLNYPVIIINKCLYDKQQKKGGKKEKNSH